MPRLYLQILALALLLALLLSGCGGGGGGGGGGSTVTVTITAPAADARTVNRGQVVALSATASATTGVARVEFFVNGASLGSDTTSPYSMNWNTAGLAAAAYTITAMAYDNSAPALTSTTTITITVLVSPVTVAFTAPPADSRTVTQGTIVTLTATATAPTGIASVEFRANGQLLGTDATAPYSFAWNTATYAATAYAVEARAYDNAAPQNNGTATMTITVTSGSQNPTVAIQSPTNGAIVSGTLAVTVQGDALATGATITNIRVTLGALAAQNVSGNADPLSGTVNFNTALLTDGAYTLQAVATDSGARTGTTSITVNVNNNDSPPKPPF